MTTRGPQWLVIYDLFKGQKRVAAGAVGSCSHFNTKALDAISVKWKTWFPHSTCFLICEMDNSVSHLCSWHSERSHGPAAAWAGKSYHPIPDEETDAQSGPVICPTSEAEAGWGTQSV